MQVCGARGGSTLPQAGGTEVRPEARGCEPVNPVDIRPENCALRRHRWLHTLSPRACQQKSMHTYYLGRISKPPPPDRGPTRLRGRSHFGEAKARSAAAELAERLRNPPDHLDRATCGGRGPPARRWECQDASYYLRIGQGAIGL